MNCPLNLLILKSTRSIIIYYYISINPCRECQNCKQRLSISKILYNYQQCNLYPRYVCIYIYFFLMCILGMEISDGGGEKGSIVQGINNLYYVFFSFFLFLEIKTLLHVAWPTDHRKKLKKIIKSARNLQYYGLWREETTNWLCV